MKICFVIILSNKNRNGILPQISLANLKWLK
nr:MAG TPA: hypothetical protein [Caudoviricetes sp.]